MSFTKREAALLVAALRNWLYDLEEGQDVEDAFIGYFRTHEMMNDAETEALIGRFQFDESQGFLRT